MSKSGIGRLVLASLTAAALQAVAPATVLAQQDPRIVVDVAPVPTSITLAREGSNKVNQPLVTYAAYQVTITNNATNTLSRVFLDGTATNFGGTDPVLYDAVVGLPASSCQAGTPANKVHCDLPSLSAYGGYTTFYVVFKGPKNGSRIDFNWTAGGFEGNGIGNGCCSQSGMQSTGLVDPTTDSSFKTQAKSFVKPTGGTLFTGAEAITTTSDGWSTLVTIPGFTFLPWTTAAINERSNSDPVPDGANTLACPGYSTSSTCFASQLSIPGTFDSLAIKIRLDKAYFNLGRTDPATVRLRYWGDADKSYPYVSYPHDLQLCSADEISEASNVGTYGPVPLPGRPCFCAPPRVIPNSDPIKELRGDLEFCVSARDNGTYEQ